MGKRFYHIFCLVFECVGNSDDTERFMVWRTIDGVTLDPLGQFNELETLVRGVLAPEYLLDFLRFFVLFEDDGHAGQEDRRLSPIPRGAFSHHTSGRGIPTRRQSKRRRGLAHARLRQKYHHDLLCRPRDA